MSIQAIRKTIRQVPKEILPYPDPFQLAQQLAIYKAIAESLKALMLEGKFNPLIAGEVEITTHLVNLLNRLLDNGKAVPGFSRAYFETITSAEELENYDGTKRQKKQI